MDSHSSFGGRNHSRVLVSSPSVAVVAAADATVASDLDSLGFDSDLDSESDPVPVLDLYPSNSRSLLLLLS